MVFTYHNQNMAQPAAAAMQRNPTSNQWSQLAINHQDNCNYITSEGYEPTYSASLSAQTLSPSSTCAAQLANLYQSYGLAISAAAVTTQLSVSASNASSAVSYTNSVGLPTTMSQVYTEIQGYSAGAVASGNCSSAYDLANTLSLLAIIWGASSIITGPLGGLAGAGFGLAALGCRAMIQGC